jgi:hypothetical protein
MSFKEDPLRQSRPVTLWLDREGMATARENFWQAYNRMNPTTAGTLDDRHTWNVAFAAAVAAFDFLMSGRLEPKS